MENLSKTYTEHRNELVELLERAEELSVKYKDRFITKSDSADVTAAQEIEQVRNKLLSNQFSITLCGGFQSGKSTTFDAICGGRELSPIGFGIKTSGSLIRATNLPNKDDEEVAKVYWRSKAEMLLGFGDEFHYELKLKAIEAKIINANTSPGNEWFDLDNSKHLKLLLDWTVERFKEWNGDRQGTTSEQLDLLRITHLVAKFWGSKELKEWKAENPREMTIDKARQFMAFPRDWEDRWEDGTKVKFSIQEIAFLFVNEVHLLIHSENLKRLGCSIVDAPGLFASKWDSLVADRAFRSADAIFFLFDGSRAITESDLKVLQEIFRISQSHKLFIGCNLRGQRLGDTQRLLESSLKRLKSNGLNVSKDAVEIYHARLALNSSRLQSLISESDLEDKTSHEQIQKLIDEISIDLFSYPGTKKEIKADAESSQHSYGTSNLPGLIDKMETFILSRRGRYALMESGSEPLRNAIELVEGGLELEENSSDKKVEDEKALFLAAEKKLNQFLEEVEDILERCNPESDKFDDSFSLKFQDELRKMVHEKFSLDNAEMPDGFIEQLENKLKFAINKLENFPKFITNSKEESKELLKAEIIPIFEEVFGQPIEELISEFQSKLAEKSHPLSLGMNKFFKAIQASIVESWDSIRSNELELAFKGIRMSTSISDYNEVINRNDDILTDISGANDSDFITTIVITVVSVVAAALAIVFIAPPFSFILAPLAFVVGMLVSDLVVEKNMRKELVKHWSKIKEDLEIELQKTLKENLENKIYEIYREEFKNNAHAPQKEFELRYAQARNRWQLAEDDRKRLAKEAHEIRSKEITPLREALDEYVNRVSEVYPTPS